MLCLGCEEDLIDARVRCSMITVKGVITATTELLVESNRSNTSGRQA